MPTHMRNLLDRASLSHDELLRFVNAGLPPVMWSLAEGLLPRLGVISEALIQVQFGAANVSVELVFSGTVFPVGAEQASS